MQQSLFDQKGLSQPLADRLRPQTLEDYVGQEHLLGPGKVLRQMIQQDEVPSMIFWGPPGVGKTTLARIIARHTKAEFVNFSAVTSGIKEIKEVMNQAEVNRRLGERTILFVDEINCVSETLAPTMLQFLQCKTFGNQQLPAGWVVVAAGNPPEYNKSVREFDVVTLDRVKKIDIEEDFGVWKEYAYRRGIHGAILSYLEIRREHFYRVEATADGLQFVTARGWEDLSELMQVYESLGIPVDRQVVEQYLQLPQVASDFANYLQLYNK